MKNSRLAASIISIILHIAIFSTIFLPIWYFSSATTVKKTTNTSVSSLVDFFSYKESLNEIDFIYKSYGHSLNFTFLNIFKILIFLTLLISTVSVILTLILVVTKKSNTTKYTLVCKIGSISTALLSLFSLTLALIFSQTNLYELVSTNEIKYTLSIAPSSGIYLFVVLEISSAMASFIAANIKENNN